MISILTFGYCFNLLSSSRLRWLVQAIVQGNRHIYLRFAFPLLFNLNPEAWYAPARWLFPELANERYGFVDVANDMTSKRVNSYDGDQKARRDIMSELEKARDPKTGDRLSPEEIASEAHLMIAAGGDTTSTALSAALFYLSRSPQTYASLAGEIRTHFTDVNQIQRSPTLSSCRYLRACIDEALRLAPAAPGALWRQAGLYGAHVGEVFVPEGLEIGTCTYALSHHAQYFHQPFVFKPARWLNRQEHVPAASTVETPTQERRSTRSRCYTDAAFFAGVQQPVSQPSKQHQPPPDNLSASVPFGIGPRSCLAKPLAYLELSLALARLIYLFDFEAVDDTGCGGPGQGRGRERVEEFQIVDMFSSNKNGPVLRFKKRSYE